jgi:hypothetical protein
MELTTSRFCSQLQLIPSENSSHLLFFTLTSTKKQAYMQGRLNSSPVTQKAKGRATRTPMTTDGELARRVSLVTNPVTSRE